MSNWRFWKKKDYDWTAEHYCKVCMEDTVHEYIDGGHERDSSNDSRKCTICGEYTSGLSRDF